MTCRRSFLGWLATAAAGAVAGVFGLAPPAEAANATYHPNHQCPRCGATVTVVAGWRRDGRHYHVHGSRSDPRATWWYH